MLAFVFRSTQQDAAVLDEKRCEHQAEDGLQLDQDVQGRARSILQRVTHRVTHDCGLVLLGTLATVVAGFFLAPLTLGWRMVMAVSGLLLVAPSWESDLVALLVAAPVVLVQVIAMRQESATATAAAGGDSE